MVENYGHCTHPSDPCYVFLSLAVFLARTAGQDDSFVYETIGDGTAANEFFVPIGVSADVNITAPTGGETIANGADRNIELTGTINLPPAVLTTDGGHVEAWFNGAQYPNILSIGGDGAGGSTFSSASLFELAEGENTFRVVAYVSKINRGLENGPGGEAGETTITVTYEGGVDGPTAPTLSLVTSPTVLPCPDGSSPVAFEFADPDGDVVTAYQYTSWSMDGITGTRTDVYDVYVEDRHACLRGTEAQCSFDFTYWNMKGGDWVGWEFWVEDAEGLTSNKISFHVTFTGDCSPSALSAAAFQVNTAAR
jgi:hypothetical protein